LKIKKYTAPTEQEAILQIKEELGKDALILNIKKIQPKGIFKIFNKPSVEVTAAYEEKGQDNDVNNFQKDLDSQKEKIIGNALEIQRNQSVQNLEKNLEKKIGNLEGILNTISTKISSYETILTKNDKQIYNNKVIQVMYDNLIQNEVLPDIANKILAGLDEIIDKNIEHTNLAIKAAYDRIIEVIGKPHPITLQNNPEVVVIMGPTGVGKTTTIAKLSSYFILEKNKSVGLITADTYRIAAVEQLKIYSSILGLETEVIYSESELEDKFNKLSKKDIIFVDTAGRSHKNNEQLEELSLLLTHMKNCTKYLVLSMTTKFSDLKNIIDIYSKISDYNIIFTKADETVTKGVILNICYLTGKPISYITDGQNVPDDIEIMKPEDIAKSLLGSIDN